MISKQLGIKLSTLTLALMLAGCGGGGSDGYYNNGGTGSGGNGSGEPGTGVEQPELASLNISNVILQDTTGTNITALTSLGGIASVKITNQKGESVSGALVTFNSESLGRVLI